MATEVQNQKTIAFVLYPGLTLFDLAGPLQIFAGVSQLAPEYRTVVVGERVEPTDTDTRVTMIPSHTFEEVPHPSVLLHAGGPSDGHDPRYATSRRPASGLAGRGT